MANREIRTLSLTPEQSSFLAQCVSSGRYQSASEVVRAALRLLEDQEARRRAELERARGMVREGLEQLDRGDSIGGEQFFADWEVRQHKRASEPGAGG